MKNLSVILLIAVSAIAVFAIRTCQAEKAEHEATSYNAQHVGDSTKIWVDKYNTEHGQRVAAEGNLQELQVEYESDMDTASDRLAIKNKQIQGLQSALIKAKGHYSAQVVHDTNFEYIPYADSTIKEVVYIKGDTASVNYQVCVPVNITQYWKRTWLLGKKIHYIDGYSTNPSATVTNIKGIEVVKDPGRWGIGPYLGVSLRGPSLGIALTYSLIRF